eukprot:6212846-Pleurochrysis_carterae.AAC.4
MSGCSSSVQPLDKPLLRLSGVGSSPSASIGHRARAWLLACADGGGDGGAGAGGREVRGHATPRTHVDIV